MSESEPKQNPSRWQPREQRRASERSRMQKHGARAAAVYANAIQKRLSQAAASKKR